MHTNQHFFGYGRVYVKADGTKSFTRHNHYSCFGAWGRSTAVPQGCKGTNKLWFSTNYSATLARKMIALMKLDLKEFIVDGKSYPLFPITFYTQRSKASGHIPGIPHDYVTVTVPKGVPLNVVYSIIKPMIKNLGSTLKGNDGNAVVQQMIDLGCNFNELQILLGANSYCGGYNYPVSLHAALNGPIVAKWCRGVLDYQDLHAGTMVDRKEWRDPMEKNHHEIPHSAIPGAPRMTTNRSDYRLADVSVGGTMVQRFEKQLQLLRKIQQENQ